MISYDPWIRDTVASLQNGSHESQLLFIHLRFVCLKFPVAFCLLICSGSVQLIKFTDDVRRRMFLTFPLELLVFTPQRPGRFLELGVQVGAECLSDACKSDCESKAFDVPGSGTG